MNLKLATVAALLAIPLAQAHATTVVVNHVMNPASVLPVNITGEALASTVTLAVGDTLDMTISFAGGARAQFTAEDGLWPLLLHTGGISASLGTTGTLYFLNPSANLLGGPIPFTQNNSAVHIGSYITGGNYRLDSAPISFSGIRQVITINSDDIGQPRDYQRIALTYFTGSLAFLPAVPEPASWAMMIAGFGLIGAAMRSRRPAVA